MSYKSPKNYVKAAMSHTMYANGISVRINPQHFPVYNGVAESYIRKIFKDETNIWRSAENISEFIFSFEQLVQEVNKNKILNPK
jgi:hypothetical protein